MISDPKCQKQHWTACVSPGVTQHMSPPLRSWVIWAAMVTRRQSPPDWWVLRLGLGNGFSFPCPSHCRSRFLPNRLELVFEVLVFELIKNGASKTDTKTMTTHMKGTTYVITQGGVPILPFQLHAGAGRRNWRNDWRRPKGRSYRLAATSWSRSILIRMAKLECPQLRFNRCIHSISNRTS